MPKINYNHFIKNLDLLIKAGDLSLAQEQLKLKSPPKIPRKYAYPVADLARRAQIPNFAIRVLNPIVRQEPPIFPPASIKELSLYAASLAQIGARKEALGILSNLNELLNPEVYFYRMYALLPEWEYQQALIQIKKYIRSPLISPYQRLVGRINLLACYIYLGHFNLADKTLALILPEAKIQKASLILENALELSAQLAFSRGDYQKAEEYLFQYKIKNQASTDAYFLYMKKWKVLIALKKIGFTKKVKKQFLEVQALAKKIGNFETLRDLDFHQSIETNNHHLAELVYFGTPYKSYRQRLLKSFFNQYTPRYKPPSEIRLDLFTKLISNSDQYFSLELGRSADFKYQLKPGQVLHRCFYILLKDLYQPLSLGALFLELFPNDFFNPKTSPSRVIQTVLRLNNWFKKNKIPILVTSKNYQFSLQATASFVVTLKKKSSLPTPESVYLLALKEIGKNIFFTSKQVARHLAISHRNAQVLCQKWLLEKKILRQGFGPACTYFFIR